MGRDRPARIGTVVLLAVAYATCEVAAYADGRPRAFGVAFGGVLLVAAVLLAVLVRRPADPKQRLPWKFTALLAVGFTLPLAGEPLLRHLLGEGFPLELQVVNALRAFGLLLAGLSAWPKLRRLAAVVALFLVLFASAMGDQPAIPYLLVAFALCGGGWLLFEHRASRGADTATVSGVLVKRVKLRLPCREAVVFGVLAAVALGVVLAGPKRVMLTLGELVPTSGGSGDTDPFARYGVGDGPEETAGENARTAGMVESEKLIEDNKDALVDVVSDMYGPPHKPRKEQEKMVAGGLTDVIQNHGKLPDNRKPSRDFDTARKGPGDARKPKDGSAARGRFEVEGRTPLHVRVVTYTRYAAGEHRWEQGRKPGGRMFEHTGGEWMEVRGQPAGDWYAADDRHQLKVADPTDNVVPTPANVCRFRIQRVDKAEYYEWEYDGVLTLAGRKKTPPGVVVNTDCRTVDTARLADDSFPTFGFNPAYTEVPEPLAADLARIATGWAGHLPRGWPQVSAVLSKLRAEYILDRRARLPEGHPAPVLWFLEESRTGPDYLFASAAALLLRSLGYPTRFCLGYYAHPDKYDPATQHTPVGDDDLHLWPEVLLRDGQWLVVEPTPGYAVLPPLKPWQEQLADAVAAVGAWAGRNAVALTATVVLTVLLVVFRRRVADAAFTLKWALSPGRNWRQVALGTVKLLERRAALAGKRRGPGETLAEWVARLPNSDTALSQLRAVAEWAAYAPTPPDADIATACRDAVRGWTYLRFAEAGSAGVPPASEQSGRDARAPGESP
jgi:protein-glutamine gamma-glutamyltransferase